jgi:hypothetical protein
VEQSMSAPASWRPMPQSCQGASPIPRTPMQLLVHSGMPHPACHCHTRIGRQAMPQCMTGKRLR